MRQAVRIGVVSATQVALFAVLPSPWGWPFLWGAAVFAGAAAGVGLKRASWMGKRPDGSFPAWSYAVWGPWHALTRGFARYHRRAMPPAVTEITDGLWVGGWPHEGDVPPETAIVDLTAELPRRVASPAYLCVPTWDHTAPGVDELECAVRFVVAQRDQGRPVLVHCAHGRGRSVMTLCAAMVDLGLYPTWEEALKAVKARRVVRMSADQRATIRAWAERRNAHGDMLSPSYPQTCP